MYIAILFGICLLFNVILYRTLVHEYARNFDAQSEFLETRPRLRPFVTDPEITELRSTEFEKGKQHIVLELLYVDFSLLVAGGFASFLLAKRTLEPIEKAHENQVRFTADASHELRTPLATMQTEVEVALRDPKLTLKESRALLESNLDEIDTLKQLTTNLLTLARDQSDPVELKNQSLQPIVLAAIARLKKTAEAREITIKTEPSKDAVAQVNSVVLKEILTIVIDNAIKYSEPKSVVTVSSEVKKDKVRLVIEDSGIGMSQPELESAFDRFYRADTARTKHKTTGHGLGLAIARQLAQQCNATIELSSKPGVGTTATVIMPRL